MKRIDPWAKKGEVVAYGQLPELLRVLRRRNLPGKGIVYDLQPLSCSGRAGVLREIQAWRCSKVPRPPDPKPPRFTAIEQLAEKHAPCSAEGPLVQPAPALVQGNGPSVQNGQSSGTAGSDGSPTK